MIVCGGRLKINCVVMNGVNTDELADFLEFTRDQELDVRFIEWMPFDDNRWKDAKFFSYKVRKTVVHLPSSVNRVFVPTLSLGVSTSCTRHRGWALHLSYCVASYVACLTVHVERDSGTLPRSREDSRLRQRHHQVAQSSGIQGQVNILLTGNFGTHRPAYVL